MRLLLCAVALSCAFLLAPSPAGAGTGDETLDSPVYVRLPSLPPLEAVRVARRALDDSVARHGEVHVVTRFWLGITADLCLKAHEDAAAVALLVRLLPVLEAQEGRDSDLVHLTVRRIADLFSALDRPTEAIPYEERLLGIVARKRGPHHLFTARFRRDLAWMYDDVGRWSEARATLQVALPDFEAALLASGRPRDAGETSVDEVESVRLLLGVVSFHLGDLAQAELLFRRVLESHERLHGVDAPQVRQVCADLGLLYLAIGDLDLADRFFGRALTITERVCGRASAETAGHLRNLASLRRRQGRFQEAVTLLYRAYGIRRRQGGPALLAGDAGMLGLALLDLRRPSAAIPFLEQALDTLRAAHGDTDPHVATAMMNLAGAWHESGHPELARPLFQEAVTLYRRLLGADHPSTAIALNNLAWLELETGHRDEALRLAREAAQVRRRVTASVLAFSSERQRLAWRANDQIDPYTLFAALGSAQDLATAALRYKGVVLDSLLDDRALDVASTSPRVERIRSLREQLNEVALGTPTDASLPAQRQRLAARESLQRRLEDEEAALARAGGPQRQAGVALSTTLEQVQAALPADAALVEFVRPARRPTGLARQPSYLALVVSSRAVTAVPLGDAERIDEAVREYRAAVRNPRGLSDGDMARVLRVLHEMAWAPVDAALGDGVKRVFVSPDGLLSFVSLATLLDAQGRFVAERRAIRYVSSGRDLARASAPVSSHRLVIFGDPRFGEEDTLAAAGRRDTSTLPRLPGTARECATLASLARARGWDVHLRQDTEATEAAVREVHRPTILHLATHGFLLPAAAVSSNPMLRSGIALAGARATLDAWRRGETPAPRGDGLLLAAEVGDLDLKGTCLVTLSACDTAMGEVRDGEGVLGLRRGFAFAGIENLMMTLWPVPDQGTAAFMVDFYARLLDSGRAPADVLDEVQREWLVRLRAEGGLTAAVSAAGPFIMDVRAGR